MEKKKLVIIGIIGIGIILLITIGVFAAYSISKNNAAKLEKEKQEKANNLKSDELLAELLKIEWKGVATENCAITNNEVSQNRFSWLNASVSPELMEGHSTNIFFLENGTQRCCGDIEKIQEKIKKYFGIKEFTENQSNKNEEAYVYSYENYGMKCIYGYRTVENKEFLCELGIICGRMNESLTNSDFQKIYSLFNNGKSYYMVVIDSFAETLDGKFARGIVGPIFYNNAGIIFIALSNQEGDWRSLDDFSSTDRRINICNVLLDAKVPPSIAGNTCYNDEGQAFDYTKLYGSR